MGIVMLSAAGLASGCAQESESILWDIRLSAQPDKTEYVEGEVFDATGMAVEAVYFDASKGTETYADVTQSVTIPDAPLELGQTFVSVTYSEDGITKAESVAVTVHAAEAAPEDFGTLTIEDAHLYNSFSSARLMISFSNAAYAGEISYAYDSENIMIADDKVSAVGTITQAQTISVTATTEHHTATFDVCLAPTFAEHDAYAVSRESELKSRRAFGLYEDGGAIFAGDSFFDISFWTDFYTDYSGRNAALIGIGGSRADEWTVYAERIIYPFAPGYVILNIGTNDLGRGESADTVISELKALFARIHYNLPEAKVCWYTITPRNDGATPPSLESIRSVNNAIADWAQDKPWFTLLDAYTQFCDGNGAPVWSMFRDNLHPVLDCYNSVYMALLDRAGADILPL